MVIDITDIAKAAANKLWGFYPGRDIKIVHLTNRMFRDLCGGAPKMPKLLAEFAATHAGRGKLGEKNRRNALQLLADDNFKPVLTGDPTPAALDELRVAIDAILSQDGAFNPDASFSTLTLTHWQHITRDPSDNGAGKLLAKVLLADSDKSAVLALRKALSDTTDATYRLTQPLLPDDGGSMPDLPEAIDSSDIINLLAKSASLYTLQQAFRRLGAHAPQLGKLELLARAGRLAGLGLWIHLLNAGGGTKRQPLLVCGQKTLTEVTGVSHRGFALAQLQLRRHFSEALYVELEIVGAHKLGAEDYKDWAVLIKENHRERFLLELEQELEGGEEAGRAFCNALVTPALRAGAENEGADKYVVELGKRLGILPDNPGRTGHHFKPLAATYDALVPALLEPGQTLRYGEFWDRAADEFGLICGARGRTDLDALLKAGMRLTPAQLDYNARAVLSELSRQGYARTYADGEALIGA